MIELRQVTKKFGSRLAVDDLTLSVRAKSSVCSATTARATPPSA
jgi:ABC-type uncharacterized transport system ATPase subunit